MPTSTELSKHEAENGSDPEPQSDPITSENSKPSPAEEAYPSGLSLALILTSIFTSMFLVSLVRASHRQKHHELMN